MLECAVRVVMLLLLAAVTGYLSTGHVTDKQSLIDLQTKGRPKCMFALLIRVPQHAPNVKG